jgi:HTH-type transcriptional regulator/antitoxin HigA
MDVRPLATEADYDWALAEIARYFDDIPRPGTPESGRFDVLSALIEHYEAKHWRIDAPSAVAMIAAVMEARGLGQPELAAVLGSRSRASEVLSGKRGLTMEQAYRLHEAWGVPAEALIRPARLRHGAA